LPLHIVKYAIYFPARESGTFPLTSARKGAELMKRYVIERDLPAIGTLDREQLKGAAATSNAALAQLSGKVQWLQSFVADDKTFCIYLADSEASVQEHARLSGFPANKVTELRGVIDPMTAMS
jgi:Nickel responsive protein SCO4226-like